MSVEMNFDLLAPSTIAEAITQMQANPGARYLAGGTDLVPNLRRGIGSPDVLISLNAVSEMQMISQDETHLTIGGGVTLAALAASGLTEQFPALAAAEEIAGPALREAATVGGNLCLDTRCLFYNQSKWWRKSNQFCLKLDGDTCHVAPKGDQCFAAFSGDLAPALLVLGAEISIATTHGQSWKPLADLYVDNGLDHLTLASGDILVAVRIPKPTTDLRSGYLKSRIRNAVDFPLAGVAVALCRDGDGVNELRVAVTGTNSRPILFDDFADFLGQKLDDDVLGQISKQIGQGIKPMRTTNLPGLYRRQMVGVLTNRLINSLFGESDNRR